MFGASKLDTLLSFTLIQCSTLKSFITKYMWRSIEILVCTFRPVQVAVKWKMQRILHLGALLYLSFYALSKHTMLF